MGKKKTEATIRSSAAEYLTFIASTGDSAESFEMRYEDENIWLTQKMMAALYDVSKQTISQHIQRICKRFSKTGLKYYNNRRKQYKTRQFRTMTVQMPDMAF